MMSVKSEIRELVSKIPNQIDYILLLLHIIFLQNQVTNHLNRKYKHTLIQRSSPTQKNTNFQRYIRMADGVTSVLVRTVFGAVLGIEKIFNCHFISKSENFK